MILYFILPLLSWFMVMYSLYSIKIEKYQYCPYEINLLELIFILSQLMVQIYHMIFSILIF